LGTGDAVGPTRVGAPLEARPDDAPPLVDGTGMGEAVDDGEAVGCGGGQMPVGFWGLGCP